jgi:hypothetical protein
MDLSPAGKKRFKEKFHLAVSRDLPSPRPPAVEGDRGATAAAPGPDTGRGGEASDDKSGDVVNAQGVPDASDPVPEPCAVDDPDPTNTPAPIPTEPPPPISGRTTADPDPSNTNASTSECPCLAIPPDSPPPPPPKRRTTTHTSLVLDSDCPDVVFKPITPDTRTQATEEGAMYGAVKGEFGVAQLELACIVEHGGHRLGKEGVHVRLAFSSVGKALSEAKGPRELVFGVVHAIIGESFFVRCCYVMEIDLILSVCWLKDIGIC